MNMWTNILANFLRHSSARPNSTIRNNRSPGNPARFRPKVHELEDRTVPSGSDFFATATVLTGSFTSDTGTNVGATGEPGEPGPIAGPGPIRSVWWQWTASFSGPVEVNTSGSDFDTILAVYTGSAVNALTLVDSNDDYYDAQSRILFNAAAGTTYRIAVDGYGGSLFGDTGNIVLNVAVTPSNDNFAAAPVFTGTSASGWNLAATGESGEPSPVLYSAPTTSVWWQWTAPASGSVEVNTVGSNFDTTLAVFTGSAVNALTLIGANDDYYGYQSRVLFDAVAGTTYHFAVDGNQQFTGSIVLNLPTSPAPTNHSPVIGSQSFSLNENSPLGTVVGTVAATDPDSGQTLTYAIIGGIPAGAFALNSATGQITVADPSLLNYEATPSLNLIVRVTDNGSPTLSASALVTINLTDVNEAPVFALTGPYRVNENSAAATPVGLGLAIDPDAGQTLTYAITGGNTGGAFAINPSNGLISVANSAALNYETTASFTLTVRATDNGSPALTTSAFVLINLGDVNEAPVIADQSFSAIGNSSAGTQVGNVQAYDPDGGQTLSYAIIGGNASGAFAIDAASGRITVANTAALGTASSFALTVRATDSGSPTLSASAFVTVTIANVNSAPVLDNTGNMSLIAVNAGTANNPGTLISVILASAGGVRVTDADAGALTGIAVIAADTAHGSWQFSTNSGTTWSALGSVSNASARLLAVDGNTRIRFVAAAGYSGAVTQGITFRAWDRTTGVNGGTADATVNGGSSAFSTATETASIAVLSAQQQINLLADDVQALVSTGSLSGGQGNALQSSLSNALAKLNQGNTNAGVNCLKAFISKVQNLVESGSLSAADGQRLIDAANAAIISALS